MGDNADSQTDNKVDNKTESSYPTIKLTSAVLRVLGCFAAILILLPLGIILWVSSVLRRFFETTEDWLENILINLSETVVSFGVVKKYYDARGEIDRLERIIKNPVAYELNWELDEDSNVWHTDVVLAERFFIKKDGDMFSPNAEREDTGFSLWYGPALLKDGIQSVDDAKSYAQVWLERFCKETIKLEDRIIFGRKHCSK